MTVEIPLDNRSGAWSEFVERLTGFRQRVQSEAAFAYIMTRPSWRRETETLCRNLGLEDYTHILEPGEPLPADVADAPGGADDDPR